MLRTRLVAGPVLALVFALGVTGCSLGNVTGQSGSGGTSGSGASTSPSEAPPLAAEPATGDTITGDGYTYVVPEGWAQTSDTTGSGTDTIAIASEPTGDFATNVNVIISKTGAEPADQLEQSAADQLTAGGATDAKVRDRAQVAGEEAAHISAGLTSSGVTYNLQQYYIPHETATYVVTFSYSTTVSDSDAIDIAESVLATWTWS